MFLIAVPKKFENVEDALQFATKLMVENGLDAKDLKVIREDNVDQMPEE